MRQINARLAGGLYILGTLAGIMSFAFTDTVRESDDFLAAVASHETSMVLGALAILLMGLSLALIPIFLFPILKKHNETMAIGYVVFRSALETVTYLLLAISWLFLLPLSQVTNPDENLQKLGTVLLEMVEVNSILAIVFCIGALIFYMALYQYKLVPRWIAIWGILGIALYIVAGTLPLFSVFEARSSTQVMMFMPLAVQEMVLALWMVFKGFNDV